MEMYKDEDDEVISSSDNELKIEDKSKTIMIEYNGEKIELPSLKYVQHLENKISEMNKVIQTSKKELTNSRLKINSLVSQINILTGQIKDNERFIDYYR